VNDSYLSAPHRDKGNQGESYTVSFGDFTGGALCIEQGDSHVSIDTRHKGYLSPPLSLEEADDLFALRILVEPLTAALASTLADPAQRNEIRNRMTLLERGPQSLNRTAVQRLELLEAILQPACRPTSLNLMRQLFFRAERYVHLAPQSGALDIGAVHALLEAWIAGESARVETLYRARLGARWAEARKNAIL
jgi:DNA-binding GntR family transcriptional regulator